MKLTIKGKNLHYDYNQDILEEREDTKFEFSFSKQESLIIKADYNYYEIPDSDQVLDILKTISSNIHYNNLVDIISKEQQDHPEPQPSKPIKENNK